MYLDAVYWEEVQLDSEHPLCVDGHYLPVEQRPEWTKRWVLQHFTVLVEEKEGCAVVGLHPQTHRHCADPERGYSLPAMMGGKVIKMTGYELVIQCYSWNANREKFNITITCRKPRTHQVWNP